MDWRKYLIFYTWTVWSIDQPWHNIFKMTLNTLRLAQHNLIHLTKTSALSPRNYFYIWLIWNSQYVLREMLSKLCFLLNKEEMLLSNIPQKSKNVDTEPVCKMFSNNVPQLKCICCLTLRQESRREPKFCCQDSAFSIRVIFPKRMRYMNVVFRYLTETVSLNIRRKQFSNNKLNF